MPTRIPGGPPDATDAPRAEPCPLCNSTRLAPLRALQPGHLGRCDGCGLVRVRQRPHRQTRDALYGASYFGNGDSAMVGYEDYAADRSLVRRTGARRLVHIEERLSKGSRRRLLDAGCALGFFIEEADARGWEVAGVDISAHAVGEARARLPGADIRQGEVEEADFAPASFDAVTMWDVIEHVTDPVATLRHLRTLLRPGGLLALTTPDAGSWPARLTGSRWMGYKLADEHLVYFDRRTIRLALAAAGFEVVKLETAGKHVSLGFAAKRLGLYVPAAASALGAALRALRLDAHAVYIDPRDIMLVHAVPR